MVEIILSTLNAKYIHAAFGLRYLAANMGDLASTTEMLEFDINTRPADIAEILLSRKPRIIGLGVYIWNAAQTYSLVRILKSIQPEIVIVLGGPEVSHETEDQSIVQVADYVIRGEADLAFADLCRTLLSGRIPATKIFSPALPDLATLELPYGLYTETDLQHRVLYVEASRGCPFSCEFCLSSLDTGVRQIPRERLLTALQHLLDRGARQLKFVDRTFNLHLEHSLSILRFLRNRYEPGHFFHFEVVPDRLPQELRQAIAGFPAGALQLEAGVQTFDEEAARRISRRQNYPSLEENLRFLRNETGAHIHADLIAGLPGESFESFGQGFDRLLKLNPHEIQVGILKRLRGTPIRRHTQEWEMIYNREAPYEILQNKLITFGQVQQLKRFARFWELVGNSGNFVETVRRLWDPGSAGASCESSPFKAFFRFTDWLFKRVGRTDSIALPRLAEFIYNYLLEELKQDSSHVAQALWRDWLRAGRTGRPDFLKDHELPPAPAKSKAKLLPKRQARHQQVQGL
jgi:radical SAM superfamily enzyme YgiQ (UPF0313 family)